MYNDKMLIIYIYLISISIHLPIYLSIYQAKLTFQPLIRLCLYLSIYLSIYPTPSFLSVSGKMLVSVVEICLKSFQYFVKPFNQNIFILLHLTVATPPFPFLRLYIYLSIYQLIYLYILYISFYLSIYIYIYHISIHPSIYLSI